MLPYLYLYSFLLIAALLSFVLKKEEQQKRLFYLVSLVLFLFIALRDIYVGTDTVTYVNFFHSSDFYYNRRPTDIMFEYIGRFLHLFGKSTEYFIFVTSIIMFFGIFYIVNKLSHNKTLSLVLFSIVGSIEIFFFLYMSMIRQACAITFYLIAVYLFFSNSKKYIIHSMVLYIAAILTHVSVLFTLPFIVLIRLININSKALWLSLLLITYISSVNPWLSVADILEFGYSIVDRFFSKDYSHYIYISFGMIEKGWFNMNLIPFVFIGATIIFFATKNELNQWYVKFFLLSVLVNNIFSNNIMWTRLSLYFTIFAIIAIPNIMLTKGKWIRISFFSIIFLYYSYKTGSQLLFQISPFASGNIVAPYKLGF